MKCPLTIPLLLAGALACFAAPEEKKEPQRQARFLAVGELPPFQQEVRDGVRYELEPPAGSIPPREVFSGFDASETSSTPLRLGRISGGIKVPPGAGPLLLRKRDVAADSEPWFRLPCPETGDFLVVLWRDPQKKTWDAARALTLPDDATTFPAGSLRILNISRTPANVVIGEEKLILLPGKSVLRQIPTGSPLPFEIHLAATNGPLKRLYAADIQQNAGERGMALIYEADGENPRRPVKVSVQREPAPPLPVKP